MVSLGVFVGTMDEDALFGRLVGEAAFGREVCESLGSFWAEERRYVGHNIVKVVEV